MGERIAERYEVLGELGAGALGEVYRVRDLTNDAVLAMKLLKPLPPHTGAQGRFEREFAVISKLEHRSIVRVHEFGMHGDRPYYTMELLDGCDLGFYVSHLRPEPIDGDDGGKYARYASRIAYILHQIADALAVAHDHEIIHRDLKPENVFVKPSKFPRARLLDFGHARADDAQDLTRTGSVLGTAHYLPPEQAMARKVTPQADLYSLGCVYFEALVGRPPFVSDNAMQVILAHVRQPAPDPRTLDDRVPDAAAELCLQLLEKNVADRPSDARTVSQALSRL